MINNTQTTTNSEIVNLSSFSNLDIHKKEIPKNLYKLFLTEKNTKKINLLFFLIIFLSSLFILLSLFLLKPIVLDLLKKSEIKTIPWWLYSSSIIFTVISFIFIILNAIELSAWKKSYSYFSSNNELNPGFVPLIFLTTYKAILKKQG